MKLSRIFLMPSRPTTYQVHATERPERAQLAATMLKVGRRRAELDQMIKDTLVAFNKRDEPDEEDFH